MTRKHTAAKRQEADHPLHYIQLTVPVSSDGDSKTVVFFPRILHAWHFGIDSEAISGFTVELLQKINITNTQTTIMGFHC